MLSELGLQRLQVFVTVVEESGYTAAATRLQLSQPSVSYHVRSLERSVGSQLLVYRDRAVHLTPEGEEVYRTAKAILNEGVRLTETVMKIRAGKAGRLSLGASIAFEHQFFFDDLIAPFMRDHPEVHLALRFDHSVDLVGGLVDRSLDIAYVNDWRIPPGIHYEPLHLSRVVFVVSPRHPLASQRVVSADQISEAGLVAAPIEQGETVTYNEILRSAGIRNPEIVMEVDGVQARKLAVQAGIGVLATFMPFYARPDAMAPLVVLPLDEEPPTLRYGLATRLDRAWSSPMKELAGWLRETTRGSAGA